MDGLNEYEVRALKIEVKAWAKTVFDRSLQYQNACWWIARPPERERLSGLLSRITLNAAAIRAILAESDKS